MKSLHNSKRKSKKWAFYDSNTYAIKLKFMIVLDPKNIGFDQITIIVWVFKWCSHILWPNGGSVWLCSNQPFMCTLEPKHQESV